MKRSTPAAPALARGLCLLDQLTVDGQASLEKLAARNQWPKSSVLRCLQTLESLSIVRQDPETRRWQALQRLQTLDSPILAPMEAARKRLPTLAEQTGHCAELYFLQDGTLTLMDRAEPESVEIMVRARIGFDRGMDELDSTALIAYAFSSELPVPEKVWVWKKGVRKVRTVEKRDRLISKTRTRAFSVDADFNEFGIRRFAIPILSGEKLLGVLAIAQRQTPKAETEFDFIQQTLQPPA